MGIDHYLDDYIIVMPPETKRMEQYIATFEEECEALGVTLAPEKKEGPCTRLVFLGIEIDTVMADAAERETVSSTGQAREMEEQENMSAQGAGIARRSAATCREGHWSDA